MLKVDRTYLRGILICAMFASAPAFAQNVADDAVEKNVPDGDTAPRRILFEVDGERPMYIEEGPTLISTLYHDGSQVEAPTRFTTKLSCFDHDSGMTLEDLKDAARQAELVRREGTPIMVNDRGAERGAGLNIVFSVSGSPPANILDAIEASAVYVESQFGDTLTVNLDFTWTSFGGLAFTQSASTSTSYTNARAGLIADMDTDDQIQSFLPTGSTLPVRFNGASAAVTNENTIDFNKDNFRAAIGSLGGGNSAITMNSSVNYDLDPSNGIGGSLISFQDVLIHEIGHALGFTSAVDVNAQFNLTRTEALDMFRFQRTDGAGDYNPDTLAEFQTTPRTIDQNTPGDDANVDIIDFEYRMADGNPNQASHFREQFPTIGVMDPIISNGETTYPDQLMESDINMFDAIGWDFSTGDCNNNSILDICEVDCLNPGCFGTGGCGTADDCNDDDIPDDCQLGGNDCNANTIPDDCEESDLITGQPTSDNVCPGDPASFSVTSPGAGSFQWKLDGVNVVNGGGISGATTANLNISSVDESDEGTYTCDLTDGCITVTTNDAVLTVLDSVLITSQPVASDSACTGETTILAVVADGDSLTYEWRKDGVPLANGGNISGANTSNLSISNLSLADEADSPGYTCFISDTCANSEESTPSTLTITEPEFVTQPLDTCVDSGQPAVISTTVNPPSGASLFVQWHKDGSPMSEGGNISGVFTDTLTINPAGVSDEAGYSLRVLVLPSSCVEFSDVAQLTVDDCSCPTPGDMDDDGDYDLADMHGFTQCFGEDVTSNTACDCANVNTGNDLVDIDDWTALEALISGP
ncbi:MAG: hypothetical protein DHS20C16_26290 [Phycisphaerae bacterium]|nr:MAG: hypothetical protein DHS20C16_26290 [Phycisphaerae bacterium]